MLLALRLLVTREHTGSLSDSARSAACVAFSLPPVVMGHTGSP